LNVQKRVLFFFYSVTFQVTSIQFNQKQFRFESSRFWSLSPELRFNQFSKSQSGVITSLNFQTWRLLSFFHPRVPQEERLW